MQKNRTAVALGQELRNTPVLFAAELLPQRLQRRFLRTFSVGEICGLVSAEYTTIGKWNTAGNEKTQNLRDSTLGAKEARVPT